MPLIASGRADYFFFEARYFLKKLTSSRKKSQSPDSNPKFRPRIWRSGSELGAGTPNPRCRISSKRIAKKRHSVSRPIPTPKRSQVFFTSRSSNRQYGVPPGNEPAPPWSVYFSATDANSVRPTAPGPLRTQKLSPSQPLASNGMPEEKL